MPLLPEGSEEVVIVSGLEPAAPTAIDTEIDFDCAGLPLSLTVAVNGDVPLVVGVPEIAPVEAEIAKPAGS